MKFYWHVHHEVLLEASDNIEERIEYINREKPKHEIEIRLKLLKPVKGNLPKAYQDAAKAYWDAAKAYQNAYKAYWDAYKAYWDADKAYRDAYKAHRDAYEAHRDEIELLHSLECPGCPWDGKTIFPIGG